MVDKVWPSGRCSAVFKHKQLCFPAPLSFPPSLRRFHAESCLTSLNVPPFFFLFFFFGLARETKISARAYLHLQYNQSLPVGPSFVSRGNRSHRLLPRRANTFHSTKTAAHLGNNRPGISCTAPPPLTPLSLPSAGPPFWFSLDTAFSCSCLRSPPSPRPPCPPSPPTSALTPSFTATTPTKGKTQQMERTKKVTCELKQKNLTRQLSRKQKK